MSRSAACVQVALAQKGPWPMDIMLHLGAHRSASTSFQTFLWSNRAQLVQRGLTPWTPRRTRDGLLAGLVRRPARISIEDERKAIRSIGRMRVEFDRLQRAGQNGVLISDEHLLGSLRGNIAERRLYPLAAERLMRFRPAFDGRNLRIGLCIRSYEAFWTSSLACFLARGGAVPTVDNLDFLTTQPRRWRHVVRDIAASFPKAELIVWPFERMAGRADAQLAALWKGTCSGLEGADLWHRRSLNLQSLNEILMLRGERPIAVDPVDTDTRWSPFDEHQSSVFRAEYRRDLAWLMAGAEGMATFVGGSRNVNPHAETLSGDVRSTRAPFVPTQNNSGQDSSAPRPDRADVTTPRTNVAAHREGQDDGIEDNRIKEGLGRTGAI